MITTILKIFERNFPFQNLSYKCFNASRRTSLGFSATCLSVGKSQNPMKNPSLSYCPEKMKNYEMNGLKHYARSLFVLRGISLYVSQKNIDDTC